MWVESFVPLLSWCYAAELKIIEYNKLTNPINRSNRSPQWSLLYVANNSRIGCAYAKYDDNTKPMYSVKCITNENDVKVVKEAYKEMAKGHCKRCNEWNEPCNVVHMGLCGKSFF